MKATVALFSVGLITLLSLPAFAGLRLHDGDIDFINETTNAITVNDVLSDGKESNFDYPWLAPYQGKGFYDVNMFPYTLPKTFQIIYQVGGIVQTDKLDTTWIKTKRAKDGTIYFILTPAQKFVLKVYLRANDDDTGMRLDGLLLPDEDNPAFKSYKELVRAAIDGKAQHVQELLSSGVPYTWPNEPVGLTPLGWSVRWNQQEAFNVLIEIMPKDFSPDEYYWCIKNAAQDGCTNILKRLLQSDLAQNLRESWLQDIFYSACSHNHADPARTNEIVVMKMLLDHFKVGVDCQTSAAGHTPLSVAVDHNDMELAEWLLSQGANPDAKLKDGTPLNGTRNPAMRKLLASYSSNSK